MRFPQFSPVLCLALAGCAAGPPAVDLDAERAALTAADSAYTTATTALNAEGAIAAYAADAVIYPDGGPAAEGTEAIRKFVTDFMAIPGVTAKVHPLKIEVSQAGDVGCTLNMLDVTITGEDGKVVNERVRDLHLWKKQADGSWKIILDLWNAELVPAP